jgi:cytochrome c553
MKQRWRQLWQNGVRCAAIVAAGAASYVHAQSPQSARALAATCFTCHGTDGRSVNGVPPSLAGQSSAYLLAQLKAFKEGKRSATIMHQQTQGYSDAQLAQIADYFAAIKP